MLGDLIGIDEVRLRLTDEITATDIRYPTEGTDDLLGGRMPDLDLGNGRVHQLSPGSPAPASVQNQTLSGELSQRGWVRPTFTARPLATSPTN
ncbi:hypothetical protein [Actinomadura kijaniata]|uniref:hypothetical protein n=1 Tax=Actinomadura kijaniata TaxID=46161 RepID=UPI000832DE91|nr:hypothetical protein [Actinomadura kijaniata]